MKSILGLLVVGFMCGYKGYTSIAAWTRTQRRLTKALGFTRENPPCAPTFHNGLKILDKTAVERVLTQWVKTVVENRSGLKGCFDTVAIDGKIMRASQKVERQQTTYSLWFLTSWGLLSHSSEMKIHKTK